MYVQSLQQCIKNNTRKNKFILKLTIFNLSISHISANNIFQATNLNQVYYMGEKVIDNWFVHTIYVIVWADVTT